MYKKMDEKYIYIVYNTNQTWLKWEKEKGKKKEEKKCLDEMITKVDEDHMRWTKNWGRNQNGVWRRGRMAGWMEPDICLERRHAKSIELSKSYWQHLDAYSGD